MMTQIRPRVMLVIFIAACDAKDPPSADMSTLFRTDSQSYTLRPNQMGYIADIGVEFTNRTADTVYFMNCNGVTGVAYEKLIDSTWRQAWAPGMNACASEPIAVAPGEAHSFPQQAFVARRDRVQSGEVTVDSAPGTYRIVWAYTVASYESRPPWGDSLPQAYRVSNSFVLREP